MTMRSISINDVPEDIPYMIDVRSAGEFSAVHAQGAMNIPYNRCTVENVQEQLTQGDSELELNSDIYVMCEVGTRAKMACEKLSSAAFSEHLLVVEGGTKAWIAAGREVVRGKGSISIERQVRIIAGLLVALGLALW